MLFISVTHDRPEMEYPAFNIKTEGGGEHIPKILTRKELRNIYIDFGNLIVLWWIEEAVTITVLLIFFYI